MMVCSPPSPIYRPEKAEFRGEGFTPPPNTEAIHNDYPLGMIIYIILIGLHHYEYEPKLCILGSYVTQTILLGLWLR